jgi:hypothetical protein
MNYKAILEANKDNAGLLRELVNECSSWDGSLEDMRVYEFDEEFFDNYTESKMEAARAVFFGDIQNWNDEYIRFNGYGNLESLSEYAYDEELKENADEITERALELIDDGSIDIDWYIESNNLNEGA